MKNKGTYHGAPVNGLAMAKPGVHGPTKATGTTMGIDTMGTGRVVNMVGGISPVKSGAQKSGGASAKKGVVGKC